MPNLLDSLFPEEGQLARLRAAVTGQGATPERLFSTAQEPDRFASAPIGNSSVYPQERVSMPTGDLLSPREARVAAFKASPVTNALMDAATPLGTISSRMASAATRAFAQKLESSGATPESIWHSTGLMRDKAGNWIGNVPDSQMLIRGGEKSPYDLSATDAPGFYGTPANINSAGHMLLTPHLPDGTTLQDIVQHKELFSLYPELAQMQVRQTPLFSNALGAYSPKKKTLFLGGQTEEQLPRTIVHEMSHGTQHIDELPMGGNKLDFLPKDFPEKKTFAQDELDKVREKMEDQLGYKMAPKDVQDLRHWLEMHHDGTKLPRAYEEKLANFANNHSELFNDYLEAYRKKALLRGQEADAFLKYKLLHGEQTAEAAAARADLNTGQNFSRPLWQDFTSPMDNQLLGNVEFWKP